jgi:hypothetical protein
LLNRSWTQAISGGLTDVDLAECLNLSAAVENINLSDRPDKTVWRWTPDGTYSAKSAYTSLHVGVIKFRGHSLIWKSWAPLRVKIFLWLAFKKRQWTNDRRAWHGLEA